jgi:hypothetical protein
MWRRGEPQSRCRCGRREPNATPAHARTFPRRLGIHARAQAREVRVRRQQLPAARRTARRTETRAACVRLEEVRVGEEGVYKIRALNGGTWIRVSPDGRRQCVRCSEQLTRMRAKAERAMRAAEPRDHCCRRTHRSATPLTPLTQISEQKASKQTHKHANEQTQQNKTKRPNKRTIAPRRGRG